MERAAIFRLDLKLLELQLRQVLTSLGESSCRVTKWEFKSGEAELQPLFVYQSVNKPRVQIFCHCCPTSATRARLRRTGGAAMSTGSAASDAEDYEACHGRRRKTTCYDNNPDRYSDEELDDDGEVSKHVRKVSKAHHQKDARQTQRNAANARERARMRVLSKAFTRLKTSLPWVPADTKLSKLDTLRLASSYISHLRQLLQDDRFESRFAHPVNLVR